MQFGDVYLNLNPATAAQRARNLAGLIAPGLDPQLGWNGAGTEHLLAEQVCGISVTNADDAVVTLLARLGNGRQVELGVPVFADHGAMVISGDPALLQAPAKAELPQSSQSRSDQATETALRRQLPAFFEAYASGDQSTLARFVAPGAHITGLGDGQAFGGIDGIYAPAGGASRQIAVTVTWLLPPTNPAAGTTAGASASLPMAYRMTVIRQGDSWDVQSIGAATRQLAQGPP